MSSLERRGQPAVASEREQEARKIRRLQIMISMVMSVIGQDPNLTVEEASELGPARSEPHWQCFPTKNLPTTYCTNHACRG